MHSQDPDTTGARDLPPLREPAPPTRPVWAHGTSTDDFRVALGHYDAACALYEVSKAHYAVECLKRSPPMNRPATVGDRVAALHFKKTGWVPCEEMAAWLETAPPIPRNEPTDMWPADLNGPTPDPVRTQLGPKPDPTEVLPSAAEAMRAPYAMDHVVASTTKPTKAPTFDESAKKLADAWAPQRKPNLPTLDAEIAAGCWGFAQAPTWSEAGDALAKADPPTTLAEVMSTPAWQGVVVTALPSAQIISCSLTVTGDTVHVVSPTADVMRALTLACYNTEHNPSIIIDGENPPILAHIVKVECNNLVGLAPVMCTMTLKRATPSVT